MFTQITNLTITIFSGDGGQFYGEGGFELTEESYKAILQLVNYSQVPETLTLTNLDFYQPSAYFIPPSVNQPVRHSAIIRGIFLDTANGFQVPIEIRMRYDARARSSGVNPYFFASAELTNIAVDSIREVTY